MAIAKAPRPLLPNLYRFAPNRETLGGSAYLLLTAGGNVLVDCPSWDGEMEAWLKNLGGVRWLCLTHRDGHSPKLASMHRALGCQIIVQEQEAYLLPQIPSCRFQEQLSISSCLTAFWTPGHSPGSACYHWGENGGLLFTGRHLLPNGKGDLAMVKQEKTFHWPRQQQSVQQLWHQVEHLPLTAICPGGNVGYLRGRDWLGDAKEKLQTLAESLPIS